MLQEFFFYCPPGVRAERGKLGRRAGPGKRALPEAECLTPASKRARLTYLATTKDVNKAPLLPDDMVRFAFQQDIFNAAQKRTIFQDHVSPAMLAETVQIYCCCVGLYDKCTTNREGKP